MVNMPSSWNCSRVNDGEVEYPEIQPLMILLHYVPKYKWSTGNTTITKHSYFAAAGEEITRSNCKTQRHSCNNQYTRTTIENCIRGTALERPVETTTVEPRYLEFAYLELPLISK